MQKHELIEVEVAGVTLGSKYYENEKKPVLMEAEENNASDPIVEANFKVAVSSDKRKVEIKKEAEVKVKVEKKEKVEIESNTGFFIF